jgi:hypothetical protein
MSTSCFLYMHKDMSDIPDVWKIGVSKSPYSAVRARQKFCWKKFGLEHLYFGFPYHIAILESEIKKSFYKYSGSFLNNIGSQTEILNIDIKNLKDFISFTIEARDLSIVEVTLSEPYTASNSGSCPFGIPIEKKIDEWTNHRLGEIFRKKHTKKGFLGQRINKASRRNIFEELFNEE